MTTSHEQARELLNYLMDGTHGIEWDDFANDQVAATIGVGLVLLSIHEELKRIGDALAEAQARQPPWWHGFRAG